MPVIGSADICYSSVRANSICNFSNRPFKECEVFKIENLASFYLNSSIGRAELIFRPIVLRDGIEGVAGATVGTVEQSSGIRGFWDPQDSERFRPRPVWLNRLVFFDMKNDSPEPGDRNYKTNRFLSSLQGVHIPTAVCEERIIDDPIVGNSAFYQGDVSPDRKIRGLRTCRPGTTSTSALPTRSSTGRPGLLRGDGPHHPRLLRSWARGSARRAHGHRLPALANGSRDARGLRSKGRSEEPALVRPG